MARHKLKPNYDSKSNMMLLIDEVVKYYGDPYDDRQPYSYDHVSLRQVADNFKITVSKARKILITANCYSIEQSRRVQLLHDDGKSIEEIMKITELSRASVQSYLPYSKNIYNMDVKSVDADRIERWREKKRMQV